MGLRFMLGNRSYRTVFDALQTVSTLVRYRPSEDSQTRSHGEERSQRAKIPTPKSLPHQAENQNAKEDDKDEKINLKEGQGNLRDDMGISWQKRLNLRDEMVEHIDGRRIEGNNEGSRDEADRIEKIEQLPCHEARCQGEEKDPVAEPPQGFFVEPLRSLLFPEKDPVKEIDDGSHRAEPPAEEIAKNEDEEKDP
jgi:hypothetical protein